jgi:alkanesulfonate monooxygenase SsuD/methylene tetrahydromethanopterin reductase-like flavin-dependent oxidoreductase (luciferase family)
VDRPGRVRHGPTRYTDGFAESLDLLLAWLSGAETVGADGRFFRFPPVTVVPAPRRPVPVWVAATSEATVEVAAARRLPVLLGMHATDEDKCRLLNHHRAHADRCGVDAAGHASAHVAYVADTLTQAQSTLHAAMPGWLSTTGQYVRIDAGTGNSTGAARDPHAYLRRLVDIHPVGPPQLCVRRLADTVATTGVRRLLLMVEGAGEPDRTRANIARLGTEVLPHLRA